MCDKDEATEIIVDSGEVIVVIRKQKFRDVWIFGMEEPGEEGGAEFGYAGRFVVAFYNINLVELWREAFVDEGLERCVVVAKEEL